MYQEEAERVVALCASDVPCIPGAERPMESREEPVPSAGLEFLVEEARLSLLTVIAVSKSAFVFAEALYHGVGDDSAVVEGQFDGVGVEDSDLGGVRGSLHLAAQDAGQEGDADIVAARVAVWLGVDAYEARDLYGEARLLRGLTHGGLMHRLPHVHKTPWQRPLPLEGFAAPADQDHPSLRGDHHVDHKLRGLRSCQGSYLLPVRRIESLCRVVAG
jgi:hypothetical protein